MSEILEVPPLADLAGMGLEVLKLGEPGVVSLTSRNDSGDVVTLIWDEVARSVSLRWVAEERPVLLVERECASKVSVRVGQVGLEFRVWFQAGAYGGQLTMQVGERVSLTDIWLRT